jgi:hypothetical protein
MFYKMSFLFDLFNLASPSNNAFQTNLVSGWNSSSGSSGSSGHGNQVRQLEPLPHGWEQLKDTTGRIYYGNRDLKTVQWDRPTSPPPSSSLDLEDLYYFYSSEKGPYIPVSEKDIWNRARVSSGNGSDQRDYIVYTYWTPGNIPKTSATGWLSQDLNGPTFFAVRVDGLNKAIIDAYNATFQNPPTPFPLKPKYFYYIRRGEDTQYIPRTLRQIRWTGARDLSVDTNWGKKGTPQNVPNTNATGLVLKPNEGNMIVVRVDRKNNSIIEAYNEKFNDTSSTSAPAPSSTPAPAPAKAPTPDPTSSSTPAQQALPSGWEQLKDTKTGRIYYGNCVLKLVQDEWPSLPSGWEELKDKPTGRISYGNRDLKTVQWEWPTSGGAKNKKKPNRRSKRRSHRHKASRRSTGKK